MYRGGEGVGCVYRCVCGCVKWRREGEMNSGDNECGEGFQMAHTNTHLPFLWL